MASRQGANVVVRLGVASKIFLAYAVLAVAFFMTGDLASNLDLYGVAGFAVIFFTLTLSLSRRAAVDPRWGGRSRATFTEFIEDNVAIATGTVSGREAMLQILLLPATLALGMIAIGLVFALAR